MPQATFVELPSESNCCGRLYPDFLSPSRFSLECSHDNSRGHSAHHLSGNAPVPRHVWAAFSQFRTIPASTGFRASTETFEKRSLKVQAQIGLPGRWTRGVRQACLVSTRKGYLTVTPERTICLPADVAIKMQSSCLVFVRHETRRQVIHIGSFGVGPKKRYILRMAIRSFWLLRTAASFHQQNDFENSKPLCLNQDRGPLSTLNSHGASVPRTALSPFRRSRLAWATLTTAIKGWLGCMSGCVKGQRIISISNASTRRYP